MPKILACSLTTPNRAKSEIDIDLCPRIRSAPPVLDGDALAYVQGLQDMLPPAAARLKARAWRLPANDMRSVGGGRCGCLCDYYIPIIRRPMHLPTNSIMHRFEEEIDVVHVVQRALGFDLSQEDAMSGRFISK